MYIVVMSMSIVKLIDVKCMYQVAMYNKKYVK